MIQTSTIQNIIDHLLSRINNKLCVLCLLSIMLAGDFAYAQWPDAVNSAPKMEFRVFPNPNAGDKINLDLQNIESSSIEVVIYNTIGSVILRKEISVQGICQILPDERLPRGLYFITVDSGKTKVSQRLIVTY